MKMRAVCSLIAGFVIWILASVLRAQNVISLNINTTLWTVGFIAIAYSVYLSNMPRDERSKQIGSRSLAWSWITTFVMLCILQQVHMRQPEYLTVKSIMLILYFTMLVSAAIFHRWLYHRGGAE